MQRPEDLDGGPVILFDGVCNLCNATVQWILVRDPAGRFRFASLQSEAARDLLSARLSGPEVSALRDAIVLVDEEGVHTSSTAAIRIAVAMGRSWALLSVFRVVPAFMRDAVYRYVARHRYRWFGQQDACMVPSAEVAGRFLDSTERR